MRSILPGLALATLIGLTGQYLSGWLGVQVLGFSKSPISATLLAIALGLILRNALPFSPALVPGVKFGLKHVLRLGIVLLGIRLSLYDMGAIGLRALPVVLLAITTALLLVTWLAQRLGMNRRLGTLIAVGTSICGTTAVMATAPAIGARDDEVCYAVACVTLFGMIAMLAYPMASHWWFDGDALAAGVFMGTAVHDTAQVAGAGLVYTHMHGDGTALDAATVTKLVRNLAMLVVIPVMSLWYQRGDGATPAGKSWWQMVPLFVFGFALMSMLRTVGDATTPALGLLSQSAWSQTVDVLRTASTFFLTVAMASIGLGTDLGEIRRTGYRPLAVGLISALLVGAVAAVAISVLF